MDAKDLISRAARGEDLTMLAAGLSEGRGGEAYQAVFKAMRACIGASRDLAETRRGLEQARQKSDAERDLRRASMILDDLEDRNRRAVAALSEMLDTLDAEDRGAQFGKDFY